MKRERSESPPSPPPDVSEETPAEKRRRLIASWERPPRKMITLGPFKVPLYTCEICRDTGKVSLPPWLHRDETDDELIDNLGTVAHFCPACREETSAFKVSFGHGEEPDDDPKLPIEFVDRLFKWLELYQVYLAALKAQEPFDPVEAEASRRRKLRTLLRRRFGRPGPDAAGPLLPHLNTALHKLFGKE